MLHSFKVCVLHINLCIDCRFRYQRLVPGRERYKDKYQIPVVGTTPSGDREVLDYSQAELAANDAEAAAAAAAAAMADHDYGAPNHRSPSEPDILDHMIERMQREQDERIVAAGGDPVLLSPNSSRRSAPDFDVSASEGAAPAQVVAAAPAVPVERGDEPLKVSVWTKRTCVQPLDKHLVR